MTWRTNSMTSPILAFGWFKDFKKEQLSGSAIILLKQVYFVFPKHELVLSLPVSTWNAGNSLQTSSPSCSAKGLNSVYRIPSLLDNFLCRKSTSDLKEETIHSNKMKMSESLATTSVLFPFSLSCGDC